MVNLIGEMPDDELRLSLSNELCVTSDTPPVFIWHTAEDKSVPVENSLLFAGALSKCGVEFSLHVFPKGAHGLGLAEGNQVLSVWPSLCGSWLKTLGF